MFLRKNEKPCLYYLDCFIKKELKRRATKMNIRSRAAMLQMLGSMFVRVLLVDRADRTDDTKTSVLIAVMHIMYDNLKN